MIGGSVVGDIVAGVHQFDSIAVELPADLLSVTDYTASVAGGASVGLPADLLTVTDYAADVELKTILRLPVDQVTITDYTAGVAGGASVSLPVDTMTVEDFLANIQIVISTIPNFQPLRSGSTVELTFPGRGELEVEIFRADQHNKPLSSLTIVDADSYTDNVPDATKNYKYAVRLVSRVGGSINAATRRSISKPTKA